MRVTAAGVTHEVSPTDTFTFGRGEGCTLCLNPADVGVSRRAGSIEYKNATWWLCNHSDTRTLAVIDDLGLRNVLAPGQRHPIEGQLRVRVEGTLDRYDLDLVGPPPLDQGITTQSGPRTAFGQNVSISDEDKLAMVALFAGYLREGSRHDPFPQSYLAAATRLRWPRTKLVKKIEHLRDRLTAAGVPNMHGPRALANLAEHALTTRLITKADLRLIGG